MADEDDAAEQLRSELQKRAARDLGNAKTEEEKEKAAEQLSRYTKRNSDGTYKLK